MEKNTSKSFLNNEFRYPSYRSARLDFRAVAWEVAIFANRLLLGRRHT